MKDNKVRTTGANITEAERAMVEELARVEAQRTGVYNFSAALRMLIRIGNDTLRNQKDTKATPCE